MSIEAAPESQQSTSNLRVSEFTALPTPQDMIAEDDKVAVQNHWTATDAVSGKKLQFRGIVIWRVASRKIVERWAYVEAPHPA